MLCMGVLFDISGPRLFSAKWAYTNLSGHYRFSEYSRWINFRCLMESGVWLKLDYTIIVFRLLGLYSETFKQSELNYTASKITLHYYKYF
jgi:hypothetical protein